MRKLTAVLLSALLFSCSGDDQVDDELTEDWVNSEQNNAAMDSPPEFGDTPETYFPRPKFDLPQPTDCLASTKADADYSCVTTFTPSGSAPEVTTSSFDRWGKLVLSEGQTTSEFEYDCDGNLVRALSGEPGSLREVVHTYEDGLLVRTVSTDEQQESTNATEYSYDAAGRTQTVTTTAEEADRMPEIETVTHEYDADGELARTVSSDGTVTDFWTDADNIEWYGDREGDGCEFGTLYDAQGNWIEDHVRDCAAFGEGHRIVRMERDEYHRPVQVVNSSGSVTESHTYDGVNPYPTTSWRDYTDSSLGAETSDFEYSHTLTSLTIRAVNSETGETAGTVMFEGVPCLPEEDGLRRGWMWQLAVP